MASTGMITKPTALLVAVLRLGDSYQVGGQQDSGTIFHLQEPSFQGNDEEHKSTPTLDPKHH